MIEAVDPIEALYRPVSHGAWNIVESGPLLTRGYWSPTQLVPLVTALLRDGKTWMSLTPLEYESQGIGIAHARGHVAIFGLGMGWSAAASALKPEVDAVTVIERDPEVIALHRELDLFARLPGGAGEKVRIIEGDAFDWKPDAPVDLLMPDIWLRLVSDGRVNEVRQMQAKVLAKAVYFWGQELEIARHARAAGRAFDMAGIAATVSEYGLPLAGPGDADYPERVRAAAAFWMRDRWFDDGKVAA